MDNFNLKRGERLVLEGGYFSTPCILCATASICSREQKKSVREGAFWPFSGLCVWGYIHQEYFSVVVLYVQWKWGHVRSLGGLFSSERRILDQLADRGERRKVKEPTFSPPRNSKWVSPLFLCAATGWLCSCFLEPPSLGRVTIFITHHWREEAWARPHC